MPPLLQDPYRALWTSSRLGSKKKVLRRYCCWDAIFFWRTDWSKVWLACLVDWSRSFSWICWQLSEIQNLRRKPSFQSILRSDCHWIGVPPWSSGEDRLSCMSLIYDISEPKLMIWYASGVGVYGVSHKWLHQSCWHPSLLGHPSDTASVASHDAPLWPRAMFCAWMSLYSLEWEFLYYTSTSSFGGQAWNTSRVGSWESLIERCDDLVMWQSSGSRYQCQHSTGHLLFSSDLSAMCWLQLWLPDRNSAPNERSEARDTQAKPKNNL